MKLHATYKFNLKTIQIQLKKNGMKFRAKRIENLLMTMVLKKTL